MSEAQCFSTCWVFCYFLFFSNPGSGAQGRGDIKGIHLNLRGTKNLEEGLSLPTVASGPHDVRAAHLGHDGEVKLVGAVISFQHTLPLDGSGSHPLCKRETKILRSFNCVVLMPS